MLAPPYDVISPAEREALVAQSPYNIARVILPEGRYDEAARLLREWTQAGVLRRDAQPAFYRYQQVFSSEGREWTRTGFICGLRLRSFSERAVLPHERTHSAPKADRLRLWRACRAYPSQVFGLYSDGAGEVEAGFAALAGRPPEMEGRTGDGTVHRLWRLTDPAAQERVAQAMAPRKVYIADGHHRYETMLALRDELGGGPRATTQFGSFFLCRMEDPGLRVLATHRVVSGLLSFSPELFLRAAAAYFTVDEAVAGAPETVRAQLARRGETAPTLGVAFGKQLWFLSLRPGADLSQISGPPVLRRLDVTLLHALLLEGLLGIDKGAQERQEHLRYVKDLGEALRATGEPGVQVVFLLNPTRLEDLRAAADAGEVLPQKSTYFFPKIASGMVVVPVDAGEEIRGHHTDLAV